MDCFKDNAKETAGSRDVVIEKDAENFMDGKSNKDVLNMAGVCR